MTILDTNILVRYVAKDSPALAQKASEILQSKRNLFVPESVWPETSYVLTKIYGFNHDKVIEYFSSLLKKENIHTNSESIQGIEISSRSNLDMVDCFAIAHAVKKGDLASFDKKMMKVFEEVASDK